MPLGQIIVLFVQFHALAVLHRIVAAFVPCEACRGTGERFERYCPQNPCGFTSCSFCEGYGDIDASPYRAQRDVMRAALGHMVKRSAPATRAAARMGAMRLELQLGDVARNARAFAALPLSPNVRDACERVGASLLGVSTLLDAAHRVEDALARGAGSLDHAGRVAAFDLGAALRAGALADAEHAALAIVRPAVADPSPGLVRSVEALFSKAVA